MHPSSFGFLCSSFKVGRNKTHTGLEVSCLLAQGQTFCSFVNWENSFNLLGVFWHFSFPKHPTFLFNAAVIFSEGLPLISWA
jgi:hypothetical protein